MLKIRSKILTRQMSNAYQIKLGKQTNRTFRYLLFPFVLCFAPKIMVGIYRIGYQINVLTYAKIVT